MPPQQSLLDVQLLAMPKQQTPFTQNGWSPAHWLLFVQVRPGGSPLQVGRPKGVQNPEQQSESFAHDPLNAPQVDDWQMLLMHEFPAPQHVLPAAQLAPGAMHGSPLTHAVAVPKLDAFGHPGEHAWPAAQHVSPAPLPHGVVFAGHPHKPRSASTHATPV